MTRLEEILQTMDVPELRRVPNMHNIRWLNRNLAIRNHRHPNFDEAQELIKKELQKHV